MKDVKFTIQSNERIAKDIYRMTLSGDTSGFSGPGQFVEIALPGLFLRRPISVCDLEEGRLVLIYKTVGVGTDLMSGLKAGETLDILTGLGHGFSTDKDRKPLLIGGGVGVPPLYFLAKEWLRKGIRPIVVLGFNSAEEIFLEKEFKELGLETLVATADGSYGVKGFVTDAIKEIRSQYDCFQTCGPLPMLRAITEALEIPGELSLEERMGCGFGACMGCSIHTVDGHARVCTDGPVFSRTKIDWSIL